MNPFILISITIAAIYGAWNSEIITSYTLNLLIEPIPPSPWTLTLPVSTLQSVNTSNTPTSATTPYDPFFGFCDFATRSVGPFPEDLRTVTTNRAPDSDDLQTPKLEEPQLEEEPQVRFFISTAMLVVYPVMQVVSGSFYLEVIQPYVLNLAHTCPVSVVDTILVNSPDPVSNFTSPFHHTSLKRFAGIIGIQHRRRPQASGISLGVLDGRATEYHM